MICAVESVGGKCLPCIVDIRYEEQVAKAVDQAVDKFGGIDVVVNNASAISLTGTASTSMKKYVRYMSYKSCLKLYMFISAL